MQIKGKTFLVIGGAGLIGSHTVELLLENDVKEVRIFDNFARGSISNLDLAVKDPRCKFYDVPRDILNESALISAMDGVDGVFHFAALWLLHCQEFPKDAFKVNLDGAINVFQACVEKRVPKIIFSSSASVYGDAETESMAESHTFNNKNIYGATKISGEALLRSHYYRYGLDFVGLRYFNVYGPRQDYNGAYIAVMMRMLDAIDKGEGPTILGSGDESFDFINVRDCARANVIAMASDVSNDFFNVCTGQMTSLKELALMLLAIKSSDLPIRFENNPSNSTLVKMRIGDPRRAADILGFSSSVKLQDGLTELVEWRDSRLRSVK